MVMLLGMVIATAAGIRATARIMMLVMVLVLTAWVTLAPPRFTGN